MNLRINQLVKTLLQKESLDQCSLQELQQFADRHPYFGAAQLLLTKKMQAADPARYEEQLQKTFLFFHNPLWVEQLLNGNGKAEIIPAKKEEPAPVEKTSVTENRENELIQPVEEKKEIPPVPVASLKEEPVEQAPLSQPEQQSTSPNDLIFEPYHTVDYFASQGIKWKEEEKPKDKFGLQLKSFTEWLKTMKRLPVTEIVKNTAPAAEKKVEEMAAHSLEDRDVLTESMAEVWEKQGNISKAIEIYGKLSLLEPSKSTYFAAKIEDLKKRN